MSFEGDDEFTGKLRLPLPPKFSGKPHEWEEWSWTFKALVDVRCPSSSVHGAA